MGNFTVKVSKIIRSSSREKECRYFEVSLESAEYSLSTPAFAGLYSSGRPSMNIKPYFDVDFYDEVSFPNGKRIRLSALNLELPILSALCKILPEGGKFILAVAGHNESEGQRETFDALNKGVPIEATYLGSLLLRANCGVFFKDWLIREGAREGPPAIQAEKAVSDTFFKVAKDEMKARLTHFITHSNSNDRIIQRSVERAQKILSTM